MRPQDKLRPIDPQADARKAWVRQNRQWNEAYARLQAAGVPADEMAGLLPTFDRDLFTGLLCGARSRQTGKPCRLASLGPGGRCRFHGGSSTGPVTAAGIARVTQNLPHMRA